MFGKPKPTKPVYIQIHNQLGKELGTVVLTPGVTAILTVTNTEVYRDRHGSEYEQDVVCPPISLTLQEL